MFAMTFNVAEKKNHDSYVLYLETKYSKFLPIILSTISILLLPSLDRSRESVKSTRSYRININRLFFSLAPMVHALFVHPLHIYKPPLESVHYECGSRDLVS